MIEEIRLKEAKVGEMIEWPSKTFGSTFADVLEQLPSIGITVVAADNNIEYHWENSMRVIVDR